MKRWDKWEIKEIGKENKDFPENLKKLKNCPEKLFFRGNWDEKIFEKTISIVGSRRMTRYGKEVISKLMPEIVARKISVISGFMYGVDCEAHEQCIEIGGKTIAVLGGGLDEMIDNNNSEMYQKILESGGIILSEYESDFKPTLWSFPQRNRIVAALSTVGVLVVEGDIKSGSLITAKMALKQKKRLMAIPGPITSKVSDGTNWLIKSGVAKMVTQASDIFEDIIKMPEQKSLFKDYSDLSSTERKIIDLLESEALTVDELCQKTAVSIAELSCVLSTMIMRDLIMEENGKVYLN